MMNFVEMGNYLLETRLKLHLSQELVADIIGVTDKTIRKIEYGVTAADLVTIMKLWDSMNFRNKCCSVFISEMMI